MLPFQRKPRFDFQKIQPLRKYKTKPCIENGVYTSKPEEYTLSANPYDQVCTQIMLHRNHHIYPIVNGTARSCQAKIYIIYIL